MNKQKILSLLLVLVLMLSVIGCSDNNENNGLVMEETNNTETTETSGSGDVVVQDMTIEEAVNIYFAEMPEHIYKIGQADFVELVKADEDMFVIDMRSAEDYAKGHIKGAVNILFNTNMSDNLQNIPTDKPVYIYCYSGQTAGQAVATLNMAGIPARSVNLGWNFGLSKVDGIEAVTETVANEIVALGNEIAPSIQASMDAFYAGLGAVKGTNFASNIVSEANFKAMMDNNEEYYLLSIRQESAFDAGHIEGANLLPFGVGMQEGFSSIPKDQKVVVYCYSGQTAGQTVAALRLLGYDAVSLKGGMGVGANAPLGWSNNGFPVVTPVSAAANAYFAEKPDNSYMIAQADLVEKVLANEDIFIIDMRSADDYAAGHIKGAVNITFSSMMADNLLNIPTDKEVFIYCYSGQTAGQAVATLNVAGIPARSVKYGWSFGLSKLDNIADVTETEANEIVALGNDINPAIQEAIDAYYANLAEVKGTNFASNIVSEDNFKAMMDNGDDYYLLSIRAQDAYDAGHIEGANLLSYGKGMQEGFATLPKDQKIVVYCYSGQTAGQTVAILRLLGYDAVSLKGGMGTAGNAPLGWSAKGYPVVQ